MLGFDRFSETQNWESEETGVSPIKITVNQVISNKVWTTTKTSPEMENTTPEYWASKASQCRWVSNLFPTGTKHNYKNLTLSLATAITCWSSTLEKTSLGRLWSLLFRNTSRCFSHRCPPIRMQCLDDVAFTMLQPDIAFQRREAAAIVKAGLKPSVFYLQTLTSFIFRACFFFASVITRAEPYQGWALVHPPP